MSRRLIANNGPHLFFGTFSLINSQTGLLILDILSLTDQSSK